LAKVLASRVHFPKCEPLLEPAQNGLKIRPGTFEKDAVHP
jgi:hypothetical protein